MNPHPAVHPTSLDFCRDAEEKLLEAQRLLLVPRPETLDQCVAELDHVSQLLVGVAKRGTREWTPEIALTLRRIKEITNSLASQIEHASNVCNGWIQLRMGTGYTEQGLPLFANREPAGSFEA